MKQNGEKNISKDKIEKLTFLYLGPGCADAIADVFKLIGLPSKNTAQMADDSKTSSVLYVFLSVFDSSTFGFGLLIGYS